MNDRFAVYADPTPYGATHGWFAQDELTEIIRYRTEEDAKADLSAIANNFSPVGLQAKEINAEQGYAHLVDDRGRLVAVLEVAAIEQAERRHSIRTGAYRHLLHGTGFYKTPTVAVD